MLYTSGEKIQEKLLSQLVCVRQFILNLPQVTSEQRTTLIKQLEELEKNTVELNSYQEKIMEKLAEERNDLEISLEAITDHADIFERELVISQNTLELEVARRTRELAEKNIQLKNEIQERRRGEDDLRLSASVFEASNEAIMITDANANIIRVNKAYVELTGFSAEESFQKNPSLLKSGQHDVSFYQSMWECLLQTGQWSGNIWNRSKDKKTFLGWLSLSAVKNEDEVLLYYIGSLTDMTKQKVSEERIYELCHFDALTRLPNRGLFQERGQQAIRRAKHAEQGMGLLFLDLDNFKAINDAFGYVVGDTLLKRVSDRLKECVDDKSRDDIARLSGDEFTLLLTDCSPKEAALKHTSQVADRVLDNLKRPFMIDAYEIFVTASIGIALYPQDGNNITELLKNAEAATYDAKKQGKQNYQFFTKSMNNTAHRRLNLQNNLRRALERNELSLHYQPQWNTQNPKQMLGVEALLRWKHPTLGNISPAEFIPLAEDTGLIIPMTDWILRTACLQVKEWQNMGFPAIQMAVNLSARHFLQASLPQEIENILLETQISPQQLELEITETIAMKSAEKSAHMMLELKALGVQLAIDDFGTGYSSLSYLKQFAVDTLKIDASFIADLGSPDGEGLVSAIISMAHNLKLSVIAEGIETAEQLEFLKIHNCDIVQGFYLQRPAPAEQITLLLQNP